MKKDDPIPRQPAQAAVTARAGLAVCLAALACLVCACGRSSTDPPPPDLLKADREAMEKAKATEQVLQDAARRRDDQMESQQK